MNNKAKELGLENTHFVTPHGLDNEEHYTTAYELAKLANYALNNQKFKELVGTRRYTVKINGYNMEISNGNALLGSYQGVYGVKTGFTNGANRCLVSACNRNDMDVITVVLGSDSTDIRTKDTVALLNYVNSNFQKVNIKNKIIEYFEEWKNNNFIEVNKGIKNYLDVKLDSIKYTELLVNKNDIDKFQIYIKNENYFNAPVYINTKIGELYVILNEKEILKSDILVEDKVEKKNIDNYFMIFMSNFKKLLKFDLE